jgi:hypothetical protein
MKGVARILKKFTGVIIILVGLAMLVGWEVYGRQAILTQEVVVAEENIKAGENIKPSMLTSVFLPKNALVDGYVGVENKEKLAGMTANLNIYKNMQVARAMVSSEKDKKKARLSSFVIKKEWIEMRSSELRKGDIIEILSKDGDVSFGELEVSHVKDINDEEISSANMTKSSLIDHVEILCESSDYLNISGFANQSNAPSLVLVQKRQVK